MWPSAYLIMQEETETFAVNVRYLLNPFEAGSFLYQLHVDFRMMLQTYVAPVCKCSTSFFGGKEQLDHDEFMQGHSFGTPLHFLHHSKPPVQGTN